MTLVVVIINPIFVNKNEMSHFSGFAADEITHCVRPEDTVARRAVILLRR